MAYHITENFAVLLEGLGIYRNLAQISIMVISDNFTSYAVFVYLYLASS